MSADGNLLLDEVLHGKSDKENHIVNSKDDTELFGSRGLAGFNDLLYGYDDGMNKELSDLLGSDFDLGFMNKVNNSMSTPNLNKDVMDCDEMHRYLLKTQGKDTSTQTKKARINKQQAENVNSIGSSSLFDCVAGNGGLNLNLNSSKNFLNELGSQDFSNKNIIGFKKNSNSNSNNSTNLNVGNSNQQQQQQQWGLTKGFLEMASQDGFNFSNPQSMLSMDFLSNSQTQTLAQLFQMHAPVGKVSIPRCRSNSSGAMKARTKMKNLPCKVPGCNRFYSSVKSLRNHVRIKHSNKNKNDSKVKNNENKNSEIDKEPKSNAKKQKEHSKSSTSTIELDRLMDKKPTLQHSKSGSMVVKDRAVSSLSSASEPMLFRQQSMPVHRKELMDDSSSSNIESTLHIASQQEDARHLGLLDNGFLFSSSNNSIFSVLDTNSYDGMCDLGSLESSLLTDTDSNNRINSISNASTISFFPDETKSMDALEMKGHFAASSSTPKAKLFRRKGRSQSFSQGCSLK